MPARYGHTSDAVVNGKNLQVAAAHLLGHWRASTTNHYVHLDDAILRQAAERVAKAIDGKLLEGHK